MFAPTTYLGVPLGVSRLFVLESMAVAVPNMSALEAQLGSLGLDSPLPELSTVDILTKPLDIYRAHLASLVATAVGCDVSDAYKAITSSDFSLGDLAVILPRLRSTTGESGNLAVEITHKVRFFAFHNRLLRFFLPETKSSMY